MSTTPTPAEATSTGLWLGSFGRVEWVFWTMYVFLPPMITVFLTPISKWDLGELGFAWVCNLIGTLCVGGVAHLSYHAFSGRLRFRHEALRVLAHACIVFVAVLVGTELSLVFEVPRHPEWPIGEMRLTGYRHAFPLAVALGLVLLLMDRLTAQKRDLELERTRAERDALASRIQALQTRTDPHFLYNALNTIAELVHEDPDRAEFVVERLSSVFRHTTEKSETALIELREELSVVRDYLSIEEARFGDGLTWSIDAPDELERSLVPALALQPLVENAVRHGRHGREHVRVELTVRATSRGLTIEVRDDGPGPGASTHRGTRTSLRTLRERLVLLYDEDAELRIEEHPEGGTLVTVDLPQEHR